MTKQLFEPGIYDMTNQQYHAAGGISRSSLWAFKKLPYKYWYEHLSGEFVRPADNEAFIVGNVTHTLLLEPQKFDDEYFMLPKINRTTKQGKLDYAEAMLKSEGKTLVKPEQFQLAMAMNDSIMESPTARDILSGAQYEKTIFWRDEETGILCKARPDIWNDPLMGDLKTCRDASYRGFQRAAMDDGYFLQAAMIYEATKSIQMPFEKFVFVCVEKTEPHLVGLYLLDDEALQYGLDLFHKLLVRFAECSKTNSWPDYGVQALSIPKYATMEVGNE